MNQPTLSQRLQQLDLQRKYWEDKEKGVKHKVEWRPWGEERSRWGSVGDYPSWATDYEFRLNDPPAPKLVPFTKETFPRDAWLRFKGEGIEIRVEAVSFNGIHFSGGARPVFWESLLENYEYTLTPSDPASWKPAGREVQS